MKVQILHQRDPDSDCDITVWVDGKRIADADIDLEDIDPGRGYDAGDWQDNIDHAVAQAEAAPDDEYLEHVAMAYQAAMSSKYIT